MIAILSRVSAFSKRDSQWASARLRGRPAGGDLLPATSTPPAPEKRDPCQRAVHFSESTRWPPNWEHSDRRMAMRLRPMPLLPIVLSTTSSGTSRAPHDARDRHTQHEPWQWPGENPLGRGTNAGLASSTATTPHKLRSPSRHVRLQLQKHFSMV